MSGLDKTLPGEGTRAKTSAQRQADLRQRRAEAGLTEVRNVFAKPEDHAKIKEFAKTLQKKSQKTVK